MLYMNPALTIDIFIKTGDAESNGRNGAKIVSLVFHSTSSFSPQ